MLTQAKKDEVKDMKIAEVLLAIAFIALFIGLSQLVKSLKDKYIRKYNYLEAQRKALQA